MANCFDDVPVENLDGCLNKEIQAGLSEVNLYYAPHDHILNFPMPLNLGDPAFDLETSVTISADITFLEGKGWGKITVQADTGEGTMDLVGNKGNKKTKNALAFYIPGNQKKLLGYVRTYKNIPMVFMYFERDGQKRLVGDKFNPAYMAEVKATTGKGGEDDKGIQFNVEAYGIPLVYEGDIMLPVAPPVVP